MESQNEVDDRWRDDKVQPSLSIYAEDDIQQEMETATPNKNVYAKTSATSTKLNSPFHPAGVLLLLLLLFDMSSTFLHNLPGALAAGSLWKCIRQWDTSIS